MQEIRIHLCRRPQCQGIYKQVRWQYFFMRYSIVSPTRHSLNDLALQVRFISVQRHGSLKRFACKTTVSGFMSEKRCYLVQDSNANTFSMKLLRFLN